MRLSHSQKLPGCGKRRTKINQAPADGQEAKMKKDSGYLGSVIRLCLLIVVMNRNQIVIANNM